MRFLIFSILIYFVAGQAALLKALDVFKKNQWSVNKVLKSNQLQAKQRADGLQRMIMAQSKIIQDLQVRNSFDVQTLVQLRNNLSLRLTA